MFTEAVSTSTAGTAPSPSTATRERILDCAMHLFGEHGFRGTSVAAIERAAGLTPGAGGLYHHFPSKDAVLEEALTRHLGRLEALRDIRRLFGGVGDLRVGLTLAARYVLRELDGEAGLLRVVLGEAHRRPQLVAGPVATVVASTCAEFAAWLHEDWAVPEERAAAVAVIALESLLGHRLLGPLGGGNPAAAEDYVTSWAGTFHRALL